MQVLGTELRSLQREVHITAEPSLQILPTFKKKICLIFVCVFVSVCCICLVAQKGHKREADP